MWYDVEGLGRVQSLREELFAILSEILVADGLGSMVMEDYLLVPWRQSRVFDLMLLQGERRKCDLCLVRNVPDIVRALN